MLEEIRGTCGPTTQATSERRTIRLQPSTLERVVNVRQLLLYYAAEKCPDLDIYNNAATNALNLIVTYVRTAQKTCL